MVISGLSPETVKDFSAVCYLTVTEMMRIQPKLRSSTTFGLVQVNALQIVPALFNNDGFLLSRNDDL